MTDGRAGLPLLPEGLAPPPDLPPPLLTRYGDHPDQFVECWRTPTAAATASGSSVDPGSPGPGSPAPGSGETRGTAVLVHGGYWRQQINRTVQHRMAADLLGRGWAVVNVEYRRGPDAAWPTPLLDVRAGITAGLHTLAEPVPGTAPEPAPEEGAGAAPEPTPAGGAGPVVLIGHSVGGQLVLLAADTPGVDAIVALAPVTDCVRTYAEGLGDDAAPEYFRCSPTDDPQVYRDASALQQMPIGRPTLIVHGAVDDRVPLAHTLDFLAAARRFGEAIDLHAPHRLEHIPAIDPAQPHWEVVAGWLAGLAANR